MLEPLIIDHVRSKPTFSFPYSTTLTLCLVNTGRTALVETANSLSTALLVQCRPASPVPIFQTLLLWTWTLQATVHCSVRPRARPQTANVNVIPQIHCKRLLLDRCKYSPLPSLLSVRNTKGSCHFPLSSAFSKSQGSFVCLVLRQTSIGDSSATWDTARLGLYTHFSSNNVLSLEPVPACTMHTHSSLNNMPSNVLATYDPYLHPDAQHTFHSKQCSMFLFPIKAGKLRPFSLAMLC